MANNLLQKQIKGPGLFAVDVVGVRYHQPALQVAVELNKENLDEKSGRITLVARLVSEPNNKHDENAISVQVNGLPVGYLDRDIARQIKRQLTKAGYDGIDSTCIARIPNATESDSPLIRIWLDLSTKQQKNHSQELAENNAFCFLAEPTENHPAKSAVTIGERVKFWSSGKHPVSVRVYANCSGYESVLVGLVPASHLVPIAKHLDADLEYEANVSNYVQGCWEINGRLISKKEADDQKKEALFKAKSDHRIRIAKAIELPYRPKKPITCALDIFNEVEVNKGRLEILRIPTDDELLDLNGNRKIIVRDLLTNSSFSCETTTDVLVKIARLTCPVSELVVNIKKIDVQPHYRTRLFCEVALPGMAAS